MLFSGYNYTRYNGNRTLESLIDFVKQNTSKCKIFTFLFTISDLEPLPVEISFPNIKQDGEANMYVIGSSISF
jgi:hypothetical protein